MLLRKLLLIIFSFPSLLIAQNSTLFIQGSSPNHFLNHSVGPKENYYSIGRLYNVSPSIHIAPFNKLKMEDGLKIGQSIMVPLVESNFSQDGKAGSDEVLVPLYYLPTGSKQSLGSICLVFSNKVSVSSLKTWNNTKADQVSDGKKIIIGFLKVKKEQSALASSAVKLPEIAAAKNDVKINDKKEVVKPKIVLDDNPVASDKLTNKQEAPVLKTATKNGTGGYFKVTFEKQKSKNADEKSGLAGIFKSTSGWDDGKYYCLFNGSSPGTILKITNLDNQKIVYAKVLDGIPDMKQNEGLLLRLSNAAAAELDVSDGTLNVSINY